MGVPVGLISNASFCCMDAPKRRLSTMAQCKAMTAEDWMSISILHRPLAFGELGPVPEELGRLHADSDRIRTQVVGAWKERLNQFKEDQ